MFSGQQHSTASIGQVIAHFDCRSTALALKSDPIGLKQSPAAKTRSL